MNTDCVVRLSIFNRGMLEDSKVSDRISSRQNKYMKTKSNKSIKFGLYPTYKSCSSSLHFLHIGVGCEESSAFKNILVRMGFF